MPLTRFKLTAIQDGGISTQKLADGAISTAKLADSSVNSAKIGTDVIVAEDLAANSITVSELTDGAVSTAKIADDAVTESKVADSAITNDKILTGTMSPQKLEYRDYFRFRLTSAVTGLTDATEYVVPFNTSGTVDFDSTSGFSGDANNTWTPSLSTFSETQFWIFGISAAFDTNNAEALRDVSVGVQQSTDGGSTWTDVFHNAQRYYDGASDQEGATLTATYMLTMSPTANHRYRMLVYVNTDGTTWDLDAAGSQLTSGSPSFDDNSVTYWWGIRVY